LVHDEEPEQEVDVSLLMVQPVSQFEKEVDEHVLVLLVVVLDPVLVVVDSLHRHRRVEVQLAVPIVLK
jgi:hypothetical protein